MRERIKDDNENIEGGKNFYNPTTSLGWDNVCCIQYFNACKNETHNI